MTIITAENKYPKLSCEEATSLVCDLFGFTGKLVALVSDRDQNFRVDTDSNVYVLKIANADEDIAFLEFQNQALEHLEVIAPDLILPRVMCASDGASITAIEVEGGRHLVRMLTYIDGDLYSNAQSSLHLFASLGTYIGKLSKGLQGFGHPAAHRPDFLWNLDNVTICEPFVKDIVDDKNRAVVQAAFDRYQVRVAPFVLGLRSAVIHNDINDNNIILEPNELHVTAVIDFGDMVFASQVNELATVLAYALLEQDEILIVSQAIISAYVAEFPLTEQEASLLFDLVIMRLVMSVCISSHRNKVEIENAYLLISQAPAFVLLHKLCALDPNELSDHAQAACGFAPRYKSGGDLNEMIAHRKSVLGSSLSLAYKEHLKIVKGKGAYLYDHTGRAFLDCVNNISHVGHCHPHVVRALSQQAATLNTNTRYLHDTIQVYAERLLSKMPEPLSNVFFVCSGSEANELALRMARTKTGRKGVVVLDWAYHGNTNSLVDISPYKFNRQGGVGCPDHVRIAEIPDTYRGRYKGNDPETVEFYANSVAECVKSIENATGTGPAAFIAESIAGVGGQVLYPKGYLKRAYNVIRGAGGVCIADEVQVGFGRVGTHMWAFEQQGVVPDIVTLGKPIGNGHPMAAVVTTRDIAETFANGMEYFNSFGGNPVSCAVGMAVLDVIENEELQHKALETGTYLMKGLQTLKEHFNLIGDVRGTGLFVGLELVKNHETLEPAKEEADWIVQCCRNNGVLLSTDGPFENVIKMKPPMAFGIEEADILLAVLEKGFHELENIGLR